MGSLTLRGALPGPQGPALPASREAPGSADQERPPFLVFLPGLQKPGEFGRETGLQVPGRRLRARWSPGEDAGSRGPWGSRPLSSERFCPPSLPGGKTALTPAFDPGEPSACP